jgi:TPR repeat protein
VSQDYAEAARLWGLAAARGNTLAQYELGCLYTKGKGVSQDFVEAARLWRLAVARGDVNARKALTELSGERAYVSACCMGCGATRKLKPCAKCNTAIFGGAACARRSSAEHKPRCKRWEANA